LYPEIIKKQIINNISKRIKKIEYINVHGTGNKRRGANPEMHYKYFNSANRNASADIFVDDKSIWEINDYNKYYTWAVGDNNSANKPGQKIFNSNSINIEICVNFDSDLSKAIENAIYVTKLKMDELNIPILKVQRHFDVSGKLCPDFFIDMHIKGFNSAYQYFRNEISKEITYNLTPENIRKSCLSDPDGWDKHAKEKKFFDEYTMKIFNAGRKYEKEKKL
jgi:N-acetylmuramoyl-L-alanine amidase